MDPTWCATASPEHCTPPPVGQAALDNCDAHCMLNPSYELPVPSTTSVGYYVWRDLCRGVDHIDQHGIEFRQTGWYDMSNDA